MWREADCLPSTLAQNSEDNNSDYGSDFSPDEEIIIENLINGRTHTFQPQLTAHTGHEVINGKPESDFLERGYQRVISTHDALEDESNKIDECFDESQQVRKRTPCSPIQQFRRGKMKNLSVTDLVTPAWCEMKFWYNLTKYGKIKQTPQMKKGTRLHKKLEREVHISIPILTETAEDNLGLQIWNVIQGLRTLQKHGLTRELHIWGTVDGNLVIGKIDELSYSCPILNSSRDSQELETINLQCIKTNVVDTLPTIPEPKNQIVSEHTPNLDSKRVYLCDVKTRRVPRLPSESEFRSTKYQLMLYHRFISILATDRFDLTTLTTHFNLDPLRLFSDSFLAQIYCLEENEQTPVLHSNNLSDDPAQSMIFTNHNISALWSLMISEFQSTFPDGAASLGNILKAEFRLAEGGNIIGTQTFLMSELDLTAYLKHTMEWWNGERAPEGVPIEETYKCKSCEFIDTCEWRIEKAEEARKKSILKGVVL